MHTVGLISDTHGLLRPEAVEALRGVDHILHAGDIGTAGILQSLRKIAPLTAVRGNNDRGVWAKAIPVTAELKIGGRNIYILHDLLELALDPAKRGIVVVVSGHSHKPRIEKRDATLFVNPGSAGPRRFNLPVTVGLLRVGKRTVDARVIELLRRP